MARKKGNRPPGRARAARNVGDDWQRWVAENLLLGATPASIADAMVRGGFERQAAIEAIRLAEQHPYVAAARRVQVGTTQRLDRRLRKQAWVLDMQRRAARQASTFGHVQRVRTPSRQAFLDGYYALNRPVVIEGALDAWPALARWTPEYFKRTLGDRIVEVQANRSADPDYETNSDRLRKQMRFGDYVDLVESGGPTNDHYMTANNADRNREQLAPLWDDVPLLAEYLEDQGPGNRGFFWYGPMGTVTPLHHDLTNNFMAQVRGSKRLRLVAPAELADVYNHRHCHSLVDPERVDEDRYPQFRNVRVLDVTIAPGDLLFLPVGWWHHVRALATSITMTFTNFAFDNDFCASYSTYDEIF